MPRWAIAAIARRAWRVAAPGMSALPGWARPVAQNTGEPGFSFTFPEKEYINWGWLEHFTPEML
jgi:hypothetical protein